MKQKLEVVGSGAFRRLKAAATTRVAFGVSPTCSPLNSGFCDPAHFAHSSNVHLSITTAPPFLTLLFGFLFPFPFFEKPHSAPQQS